MLPATTPSTRRVMEPLPMRVSPMTRAARASTTMPVPLFTSAKVLYWATMAPDRPVMALATHRPTVMVKLGLMEEARTMSALSPVARMDRPSRVPRKRTSRAHRARTMMAVTASSYQLPAKPASLAMV